MTIKTIKCAALMAFTQFVPGYGMVHGDPDNEGASEPEVPVTYIEQLEREGRIEPPAGWAGEAGDAEAPRLFSIKHVGGGMYEIFGPGVEPGTKVKGKVDAQTTIDLLEEEHGKAAGDNDPPSN